MHSRVLSFDDQVLTLNSMRKPKRLVARGDDEREYMYLVKGGEDIRNDERVEQLLALMGAALAADPACAQARLRVRTYAVVPMTTKIGVIEWVQRTAPLKALIEAQLLPDGAGDGGGAGGGRTVCLLYTSPSPRDGLLSRMPSSA